MEKKHNHVSYGLVAGLACVLISIALQYANLQFEWWARYLSYPIMFIGIYLNAKAYAESKNHYITFGQLFISGLKVSAIITLVLLAGTFLMMQLFPDFIDKMMEMSREKMMEQNIPEETIDQWMTWTKKFMIPNMISGIVFETMIVGLLLSLLASAFIKRKNPELKQLEQLEES